MPKKSHKRLTAQGKVAILQLHLLEHIPISDLCDHHSLHPTMFYRWQKEFLSVTVAEGGSPALSMKAALLWSRMTENPLENEDR
jgi:transposase-like protein